MLLFGGSVRVTPYETFGTPELAEAVVEALAERTAALMSNHGAVTYAETLETALERTELLEWACEIYSRAAAVGEPRTLDTGQQQAVVGAALERRYGSLRAVEEEG
jgi:L-fuculose-phosphate aldolase